MNKLKNYLTCSALGGETAYQRYDRFGKEIGVSGACVRKWLYKQRSINDLMKRRIVAATEGEITFEDMLVNNVGVQKRQSVKPHPIDMAELPSPPPPRRLRRPRR
jgi:hypothetical protein